MTHPKLLEYPSVSQSGLNNELTEPFPKMRASLFVHVYRIYVIQYVNLVKPSLLLSEQVCEMSQYFPCMYFIM
jgi:hypothetical protein